MGDHGDRKRGEREGRETFKLENVSAGNTKGGSITVLLTSCLTSLD